MPRDHADARAQDAELLRLYAAGDVNAAQTLTDRLTPKVFAHAMRLLNDRAEAEDVAQEAMLRLWRIAPDWQAGTAQVSTWLYRVTANLCLDRLRRRGSVALDAIPEPEDTRASALTQIQDQSRADALQSALMALPARQREAVVLRHIESLANTEVAQIMDISVEAVESLIARGKRTLTGMLAGRRNELGYEDDE